MFSVQEIGYINCFTIVMTPEMLWLGPMWMDGIFPRTRGVAGTSVPWGWYIYVVVKN